MSQEPILERIAAALERLSPPPAPPPDPASPAFVWGAAGLQPVANFAPLPLAQLSGIDAQRDAVLENSRRLAAGHAAHDILLWGARGSGKSALVKSCVAALQGEGAALRLIEIAADQMRDLPKLFAAIAHSPAASLIFIDDRDVAPLSGAARQIFGKAFHLFERPSEGLHDKLRQLLCKPVAEIEQEVRKTTDAAARP